MNTKVAYMAICGDYDKVYPPTGVLDDWDYILFTDNPETPPYPWVSRPLGHSCLDPQRRTRIYKLHPHHFLKEYEESLYIDGSFQIMGDLNQYIGHAEDKAMLCIKARAHNCLYTEGETVARLGLAYPLLVRQQLEYYHRMGYPPDNGMIASGVLYRRHHNPEVVGLMETWWNELYWNCRRDQVSFNYCAWLHKFDYATVELDLFSNPYFFYAGHKDGGRMGKKRKSKRGG